MTLEQRVVNLERRAKFHHRLTIAFALGLLLSIALAVDVEPGTHNVLRAQRLEVTNQAGQSVFIAEADSASGHGKMVVQNADAMPVVIATGSDTGGSLMFFDNNRKLRLSASADEYGGFIQLLDENEKLTSRQTAFQEAPRSLTAPQLK